MKTLVTVGEFYDNGGKLKEGRTIWTDSGRGTYQDNGEYLSDTSDGVKVNYACNIVEIHREKAFVQIPVTPQYI